MQKKLFLVVLIPLVVFFMTSGCMESMVKPTAKTDTHGQADRQDRYGRGDAASTL
ncbi:MAG: hypothetical protein JRI69_10470 [Deltaproteobacteria bacterium]|nr:hypothetical protein [Deltaproteobacteria bacterium]